MGIEDYEEAAARAFVHWYASVDLYKIMVDQVLDPASAQHKAALNSWGHERRLADPSDTAIVAMNVDTPYSYAWLDLRAEPVVVTLPPFERERYMSAMVVDFETCILGYVSPRTNGNAGGDFLVAGPDWDGDVPAGITGVFQSPTRLALILLRTQLFDNADMSNVIALQDRCAVTGYAQYLGGSRGPAPAPALVPVPVVEVRGAPDPAFFNVVAWMLPLIPERADEAAARADLATLGVEPGVPFAPADAAHHEALVAGMGKGFGQMAAFAPTIRSSGEIFGSREHFAGNDMPRAAGAMLGILGNAAEEYLGIGWHADVDGQPFDGSHRYVIRFGPETGFPPVDAFWSITLYDGQKHLYANAIDRYVINTRGSASLVRDPDGGVTVHVQHDAPTAGQDANWLPCPAGPFGLTFRTYLPRGPIRDGSWTAPPVRTAD